MQVSRDTSGQNAFDEDRIVQNASNLGPYGKKQPTPAFQTKDCGNHPLEKPLIELWF